MKLVCVIDTEDSRVYGSRCLGANSIKGDLSISDSISKYVKLWLIWVKSINETKTFKVLSSTAENIEAAISV
jgi:hypothetical protein